MNGADESSRVVEPGDAPPLAGTRLAGWPPLALMTKAILWPMSTKVRTLIVLMSLVNERSRTATGRSVNRYIK